MAAVIALIGLLAAVPSIQADSPRAGYTVSKGEVEASLISALAGAAFGGRGMKEWEDALRSTYEALPKNMEGNLESQAVRPALQRLSWFIKGLELNVGTWRSGLFPASATEWVPSYLQDLLDQRVEGHGIAQKQFVALAAALGDLIRKEVSHVVTDAGAPRSHAEELRHSLPAQAFVSGAATPAESGHDASLPFAVRVAIGVVAVALAALIMHWGERQAGNDGKEEAPTGWHRAVALSLLALAAYVADILDGPALACTACGGCLMLLIPTVLDGSLKERLVGASPKKVD